MPEIHTTRLRMHYESHGDGEPLLLIRGLGSTCDGFKAQVEGLAPHLRVIAFDNRCVGRTDQSQEPFTIADMADDTAALLDALEVESAHVTHPTLVLTGTEDSLVDPANSRLIADHIPGARLIQFEETGHVFFTERADDVNRALIDFFQEA